MKFKFLILLVLSSTCFSQTKQEREYRIKKNTLPKNAIVFADHLTKLDDKVKRLRFYKEIDGDKMAFEVKFKLKKNYYSAEFDTEGNIEDIEVLAKSKDLENKAFLRIESYMKNNFKKSKFLKIQKQFVTNGADAKTLLYDIMGKDLEHRVRYEIIAEVTENRRRNLREFLFDTDGSFIKARIVAPSSYGHVLY